MGSQKAKIAWAKIKNEYISSDISYRELAKKHNVSLRAIAGRAKEENWQDLKQSHCNTVAVLMQQKTAEKQAKSFAEFVPVLEQGIVDISTKLLEKINETMEYGDAFSPRDLKSLSSMVIDIGMLLKDVKEDMNTGSASADKITVEFVKGEWDYGGPES